MPRIDPKKAIPPQAQRVFKGVIYDVYHWQQEMFNGTQETFERLKRPDTVEVIAVVGDRILLQEQQQPTTDVFLSLPGGRVDQEDDALIAAKRELLEESGYESDAWLSRGGFAPASHISFTVHSFIARDCRKVEEPHLDAGEKISYRHISFDEFLLLSENDDFQHQELRIFLALCRLDPEKRENFRKLLFRR